MDHQSREPSNAPREPFGAEDQETPSPRDGQAGETSIPAGLIEKGSVNVNIGCLGAPGSGKSTYALARALSFRGYHFAHDLGWKLKDKLPDGRVAGLRRYESIAECRNAIASDARGVHCVATLDAKEVIELGSQVAMESVRRNGGTRGIPSIVLIDEAVSAGDADPYRLGKELRATMALRRHRHTGILWTCQSPNLCHYQMLALSTELVIFRLTSERDLRPLADIGVPAEALAQVRTLPDYHYLIHHNR